MQTNFVTKYVRVIEFVLFLEVLFSVAFDVSLTCKLFLPGQSPWEPRSAQISCTIQKLEPGPLCLVSGQCNRSLDRTGGNDRAGEQLRPNLADVRRSE